MDENENASGVSPDLVKQLTEKAAAEMGIEVASLIPLMIGDIVRERSALALDSYRPKTARVPLTVTLLSATAGRVAIGECTWSVNIKARSPGFPAIEVDVAQPELEFKEEEPPCQLALPAHDASPAPASACATEEAGEDGSQDGLEALMWKRLEESAALSGLPIVRPCTDPLMPSPETIIEVYAPDVKPTRWRSHCLGSAEKAEEYAHARDAIVMQRMKDALFLTKDTARLLIKYGLFIVHITDTELTIWETWDKQKDCLHEGRKSPASNWGETMEEVIENVFKSDGVPDIYLLPIPKGHRAGE